LRVRGWKFATKPSARITTIAFGHSAASRALEDGQVQLPAGLPAAAMLISENVLRRQLGLMGPLPLVDRSLGRAEIERLTQLSPNLISCLGLFGLASFSAEQRKKEIGVRKVLGAGITGIVKLLSIDFLKLVGIAILVATPVAWWAMNKWLQAFAYRIDIHWWMFALSGLLAIFIAMVTISFQAIKAAMANPVKSLRTE